MDRQRTFFYGFIIGVTLMIVPIHPFFFWRDVMDIVDTIFRYLGFVLFLICGGALIKDLYRVIVSRK
ncbi:hypothetical protein [Gottfriedia solisilvae]|uniref:Uncharacterized protein n=1 Tax=Gottfriedia solisilvae TaxID=1516104 RepID=A0A8J3EUG3_9BACI|nr:hypothetical protein [Gottfriedia solisilvae]GGI11806.1 hypothetical protein GCM10007380_09690 [Gottfriedia solisilvae]